jgi:hypothetical protein
VSIFRISSAGAVAGALLLIAGCGSSASTTTPAGGGTSSSGTSSSKATASPTVSPATAAQLKKIALRPGDLPAAWKGTPYSDDGTGSSNADLTACVGAKNTDADQVATADSDDYSLGDATISSSATSYRSQSDVESDVAVLANPKLSTCFASFVKKDVAGSLPAGTTVGNVSVKFTPGPGTGPSNVAGTGQATIAVNASGQQVPVYITFVYLTGPNLEVELDAENPGTPVPASVLQPVIQKLAARAAAG